MRNTIVIPIIFFAFFALTYCQKMPEPFSIVPLEMYTRDYSMSERALSREEYYLVSGFKDDQVTQESIDSFVCANLAPEYERYDNYFIYFYRKSRKTNVEYLSKNFKEIDRYSNDHDLIVIYTWRKGRLVNINKYFEGDKMRLEPVQVRNSIQCAGKEE